VTVQTSMNFTGPRVHTVIEPNWLRMKSMRRRFGAAQGACGADIFSAGPAGSGPTFDFTTTAGRSGVAIAAIGPVTKFDTGKSRVVAHLPVACGAGRISVSKPMGGELYVTGAGMEHGSGDPAVIRPRLYETTGR